MIGTQNDADIDIVRSETHKHVVYLEGQIDEARFNGHPHDDLLTSHSIAIQRYNEMTRRATGA